jgi:predicted permease
MVRDLRYALRLLARSPGFTLVALGSLALGIGANTAIFSLVNAVLLRPMPVAEPEALVSVFQADEQTPGPIPFSHLNFKDVRAANTTLEGLAAVSFGQANLRIGSDEASQVPIQIVSGSYFDVMRVPLELGRGFQPDEDEVDGARPVAVISWGFWQRQLGGNPDAIGTTITLNRTPFAIVGVTPRTFTGTFPVGTPAAWVPTAMHAVVQPEMAWYETRRGAFLFPVGRLKPGVTVDQARSNLQAIMARLAEEYPVDTQGRASADVQPLLETRVNPGGQGLILVTSRLLLAVVGIVLVIACANLANLLLARATRRRRELAVRFAIGANRGRVIRQLLTESLTLSVAGGALGLLVANWMLRLLAASANVLPIPIDESIVTLDGRVLAYTAGISVVTGLLFGLFPALEASRTDVASAVKQESLPGESRGWLRKSLVAVQVALSVVSLVAAGLFLRSLQQTVKIEPGFDPANVTTLAFNLGREGYDPERGTLFYRALIERARSLPGVQAAAVAESIPLAGVQIQRTVYLSATPPPDEGRRLAFVNYVTPGYFETTRIPLVRGREFEARDAASSPSVAIVNETLAQRFWPDQDALGKRFWFFGETEPTEVIGIARDSKVGFLAEDPQPLAYEPMYQDYRTFGSLLVRTAGPTAGMGEALRGAVAALDPDLTVLNVRTLDEQIRVSLTGPQTLTTLVGAFGAVALLLAAMGLYGVASHSVSHRTREIGVRMALGAQPGRVLRLVLRQSLVVVGLGLVAGLLVAGLAAAVLGSQISALLVEVSPADPVTLAGTVAILFAVGVLASLLPARRAARIDPLLALRQD